MYITWNGVALSDLIKITDITKTSTPSFDHTLLKVVGRMGFQYAGTVYGAQKLDISFVFVESQTISLDDMPSYLGKFFGVEPGQLRIINKPGFYYNALLDPPPDVSGIAFAGEGSIGFNLWEGFAWSDTIFTTGPLSFTTTGTVTVNNNGDFPTRGKIIITPSVTISGLKITNQTTGEVLIADTNNIAPGSQIICDMYREELYLSTGQSLMPYVSLNSTFFDLIVGNNNIEISNPYGAISGTWEIQHQTRVY